MKVLVVIIELHAYRDALESCHMNAQLLVRSTPMVKSKPNAIEYIFEQLLRAASNKRTADLAYHILKHL